tara:strand:+ start:200 stop:577 length:378 start_codon:yes stop_codon:yes gene_type:complete
VDGNVLGREALVDDAVNVLLGNVGEGDVRAVYKGEPIVVVFKIEAPAHAAGHLMEKAEDALVVASSQGHLFESKPHGLSGDSRYAEIVELTVTLHRDVEQELGTVHLEIDEIADFLLIDAVDAVS